MITIEEYLALEQKLILLHKKSLSLNQLSKKSQNLKKISNIIISTLEAHLKEIQAQEKPNIHWAIKQSNKELLNTLSNILIKYKIIH